MWWLNAMWNPGLDPGTEKGHFFSPSYLKKWRNPKKLWSLGNSCFYLVAKSYPTLLWPHRLKPSRLLCPWGFPGKHNWVGCPLPDPGIKPRLLPCRRILYHWATWEALRELLCGRRRAERSSSTFTVRSCSREKIPLIQGQEQRLRFAGAAVKRKPTSKVRETQVRR